MEQHRNFKIQLFRAYPQIAQAVEVLVKDYNRTLEEIVDMKISHKGKLEVEAFFGRIHVSHTKAPSFNNNLNVNIMKQCTSLLSSFSEWNQVVDWYLVYDYYLNHNDRVRVSYPNGIQDISVTRKHRCGKRDFSYVADNNTSSWQLRDYLTRVQFKFEENIQDQLPDLLEFQSVRLSVRKSFSVTSQCIDRILWRFEIQQFWIGKTIADAEHQMLNQPPQWSIECEIVNLPHENILPEEHKYLLFASLLLKMQDFLDFPVCFSMIDQPFPTRAGTLAIFHMVA